jgi:hypothetical protein
MRKHLLRALAVAATVGLTVGASGAGAAPATKHCGSVSYTYPHTGGHGHEALNNLTAVNVSCGEARTVAKFFIVHKGKVPKGWHAKAKSVTGHKNGQTLMVGEEIFTRGDARVVGDVAN